MANRIKLSGTTLPTFEISKGKLDFTALTAPRVFKFLDMDNIVGLVRDYIGPGETLTIPPRHQYITIGLLEVDSSAVVINDGTIGVL